MQVFIQIWWANLKTWQKSQILSQESYHDGITCSQTLENSYKILLWTLIGFSHLKNCNWGTSLPRKDLLPHMGCMSTCEGARLTFSAMTNGLKKVRFSRLLTYLWYSHRYSILGYSKKDTQIQDGLQPIMGSNAAGASKPVSAVSVWTGKLWCLNWKSAQ